MITRRIQPILEGALKRQAAVALLGPRQVGKTTLAWTLAQGENALYLDLESPPDRQKLSDPVAYLRRHSDRLVVLDEIHRVPELFQVLRGLIDEGRREGRRHAQYLLLGSASMDLLRQSGESLAGRIAYVFLGPFDALEVGRDLASTNRLWIRGGFPESFLAENCADSLAWRRDFIQTYLERDIPLFGPRVPAETLRRLWTMLAHAQGGLLNASRLAASLSLSTTSVTRYIDLFTDLLLVRRLPPFHGNLGKRLVKSPKVYVRDSGLLHALLGIADLESLASHPVAGMSWEGFVVENLLSMAPADTQATFYRTAAGAEMDLCLDLPGGKRWVVEIKLGSAPACGKGFHHALQDLTPDRAFVVYSGLEPYPLSEGVEAMPLGLLARKLAEL